MRKQEKKAISLIVLVITIIVMIILAGTVILALSQNGIIGKANDAVDTTNLKQVEQAAMLAWADAYAGGKRTEAELKAAVTDALKDLNTSKYNITVTDKGVTVTAKPGSGDTGDITESEWVTAVTPDGVPIPKGFVASPYGADEEKGIPAENTKAGGLVIYELHDGETAIPSNETQEVSWATRNQFVWIPVDKDKFETEFVRRGYEDDIDSDYYVYEVELDENNMPMSTLSGVYQYILSSNTLAEVQSMYASVKEYGGFYIARYEAGISQPRSEYFLSREDDVIFEDKVYSMMNKFAYNNLRWSNDFTDWTKDTAGAVSEARRMYPQGNTKYGVVSTLTYGVQWDRVLSWYEETETAIPENIAYLGNYYDREIQSAVELNKGARYTFGYFTSWEETDEYYFKGNKEPHILTTGALKTAKINNIYDMAGNVAEYTMETHSLGRIARGGSFLDKGEDEPIFARMYVENYELGDALGFRPALYIKIQDTTDGVPTQLDSPTISITEDILKVTISDETRIYTETFGIYVNGEMKTVVPALSVTEFDISTIVKEPGTKNITVKAIARSGFDALDSAFSNSIEYTIPEQLLAPTVSFAYNELKIKDNAENKKFTGSYEIYVNGEKKATIIKSASMIFTYYKLTNIPLAAGTYNITVKAVPKTDFGMLTSLDSEIIECVVAN